MSLVKAKPALLVLADGTTYHGRSFGATGTTFGEVVFNTGMTGYQEVLTDPSYRGQIVTFTYPELGNTGVTPEDEESSRPQVKGAIARNIAPRPSNWRSTQALPDYLKEHQVVGIYGIDTRDLTRRLRVSGAMNGAISTEILDPEELLRQLQDVPSMEGQNLVKDVTTASVYEWTEITDRHWEFSSSATEAQELTVVAIDFGVKRNILRRLASYGCRVIVVPPTPPPKKSLPIIPMAFSFPMALGIQPPSPKASPRLKIFLRLKNPPSAFAWGTKFWGFHWGLKLLNSNLATGVSTNPLVSSKSKLKLPAKTMVCDRRSLPRRRCCHYPPQPQ